MPSLEIPGGAPFLFYVCWFAAAVAVQADEYEKLGSYAMIGLPDVYKTRYGESCDGTYCCSSVPHITRQARKFEPGFDTWYWRLHSKHC